jgi:hypothetical protein
MELKRLTGIQPKHGDWGAFIFYPFEAVIPLGANTIEELV